MTLPNFEIYRPGSKWSISDQEWECMMLKLITMWDSYVYEYNSYIVSKVKASVLKNMIPPVHLSRSSPVKTEGRWAQKDGLDPDDRRPNFVRSLTTYGDLFFGTPMGKHREFREGRGRKFSKAGSFVIFWDLDRDMDGGMHPRCKISKQYFYNSLAAVYALTEEAKERGDLLTFITMPGSIDGIVPAHDTPEMRKAPVMPMLLSTPPLDRVMQIKVKKALQRLPLKHGRRGPSYRKAFKDLNNVGPNLVKTFDESRDIFEYGPNYYGSVDPMATDGLIEDEWKADILARLINPISESERFGRISKYYWWINTDRYDEILDEILHFKWEYHDSATSFWACVSTLRKLLLEIKPARRGVLILVTSLAHMCFFWPGYHYYADIARDYDMYIVDVGDVNWSQVFRREPTLQTMNGPMFNYVHVNTLVDITVSPQGFRKFENLSIIVSKKFDPKSEVEVHINLNDGAKTASYHSDNYPTISELQAAVSRDFPELAVSRDTSPSYKVSDMTAGDHVITYPDGIICLSGYDLENLTYKMMKMIGGHMNGVTVT
ncbi:Uncharacterised protein [uncultured archaeon]|nr:Uncharacterised protein [uncultured archaeon]